MTAVLDATYSGQEVARYRGNPFIEALPPIKDTQGATEAMQRLAWPTAEQLSAPAHVRMHEVEASDDFFQPLTPHLRLYERVDRMIRCGYLHRNPLSQSFLTEMGTTLEAVGALSDGPPPFPGTIRPIAPKGRTLAILGMSGVGKTQAIRAVLGTYPDVIRHPRLSGPMLMTTQLVHLTLTCPEDGTVKGLCFAFLEEADRRLGTNYLGLYGSQSATLARLRVAMARISWIHGLGMLVIDEVQHLSEAKSGGAERMMAFFKILSETVGVPVVVVGTPDAGKVVGGDFPTARRHTGEPLFDRQPLRHGSTINPELRFFHERLFSCGFLRSPILVDDALVELMHGLNQGIPALDVKLFVEAQQRALEFGSEEISHDLLREVHRENFGLLHPHLAEMASGSTPEPSYESDLRKAMGRTAVAQPAKERASRVAARARKRIGMRPKSPARPAAETDEGYREMSAEGQCRAIGAELIATGPAAFDADPANITLLDE